jgi:hypothetical protein
VASTRMADRKVVGPSVGAAVDAFLGTLANAGTARNYAGTLYGAPVASGQKVAVSECRVTSAISAAVADRAAGPSRSGTRRRG